MCRIEELKALQNRALELVRELSDEEKELIRELASISPNKYLYLGYVPVHLRGSVEI